MRALGDLKKTDFYMSGLGRTADVLIESKRDPASGLLKGFTSNLTPVLVDGGDELQNTFARVFLKKTDGVKPVLGELVSYSQ